MPDESPRKAGRPVGTAGPMKNTVRIFATVKRETAEKLERIARENGFQRKPSSKLPFFGGAIDILAKSVETKEPEYLKLARELSPRIQGFPQTA